jgi:hypothetical protein
MFWQAWGSLVCWMSLREELLEVLGLLSWAAYGCLVSAQNLVGVLRQGPVEGRKHLVLMWPV